MEEDDELFADINKPRGSTVRMAKLTDLDAEPTKRIFLTGKYAWVRFFFILINTLGFLMGLVVIGLGVFTIASSFRSAATPGFAAGLLILGVFVCIITIGGVLASLYEHRIGLAVYFGLIVMVALLETGLMVFIVVQRDSVSVFLRASWEKADDETKNKVQLQFECCGFDDRLDLSGSNCRPEWSSGCFSLLEDFVESHEIIVIAVGVTLAFLQLVSTVFSCLCYLRIPTKQQQEAMDLEESWMRTLGEIGNDVPNGVY